MGFNPTDHQIKARREVRALYDLGYRMVGQWCKKLPDMTMSRWRSWESQSGFMDWWTDMLPEHSAMTVADLRALEYEANIALMERVTTGDPAAIQIVLKMSQMASERSSLGSDESLEQWFQAAAENNWIVDEA
jgi:hypothetical protein